MTKSTHHSFDINLAAQYGIPGAILIHHLQHWINHNMRLGRNRKDGKTWTYQTRKEIAAWFPYLSEDQVKRELIKLVKDGVIVKGNYNRSAMDKTTWYAFVDEEKFTMGDSAQRTGEIAQHTGDSAQPIPDTKTDPKPDAKKDNVSETMPPSLQTKRKNFYLFLPAEQRKLHDKITKYKPKRGKAPESDEVCAWFLACKFSVEQVSKGFKVYKQDECLDGKSKQINSMGAYIRTAIDEGREPRNVDFEANKAFANSACLSRRDMVAKENYLRYQLDLDSEVIPYSLPTATFINIFDTIKRKLDEIRLSGTGKVCTIV